MSLTSRHSVVFRLICSTLVIVLTAWVSGADTQPSTNGGESRNSSRPPGIQRSVSEVDRMQTPDQVPDHVAYLAVLRTVGPEVPRARERAYARRMLLGSPDCPTCSIGQAVTTADVEAVLAVATQYGARLRQLDQEARAKSSGPRTPAQRAEFAGLNARRQSLALEFHADLLSQLSPTASIAAESFFNGHVKSRIKMLH